MVRSARLELARLAALPPQDSVSANSTTTANTHSNLLIRIDFLRERCSLYMIFASLSSFDVRLRPMRPLKGEGFFDEMVKRIVAELKNGRNGGI